MFKRTLIVAGLLLGLAGAAHADGNCDPAQAGAGKPGEYQRLLDCAQQSIDDAKTRLNYLSDMKLADLLAALEHERDILNGLVDSRNAALSTANADIAKLVAERDQLQADLASARQTNADDADRIAALQAEVERLAADLKTANAANDEANGKIAALQGVIDQLKAQIDQLVADLKATKDQVASLEAKIDALTKALAQATADGKAEAADLTAKIDALQAQLAEANDQITALNAKIDSLSADLAASNDKVAALTAEVAKLTAAVADSNAKIAALQDEIAKLNTTIADLTAKLKAATDEIAALKDKLDGYRQQFLARLKAILGDRADVVIDDNRVVVAAEVLFPPGSADLDEAGTETILKVATVLNEIGPQIPPDLKWALQVNGHTDINPIKSRKFASNWELSTARALSVVKVLEDQCVPPVHLAAAGFGEYQPLAAGKDPETLRHNRRIEMEITNNGLSSAATDTPPATPCVPKM
ncbi:MAG TPA: OmpA family protein [Bauldia sp.]|nr:OmpA family protein [Bauldia sp.]